MQIVIDISNYDVEWINNAHCIPDILNYEIADAIIDGTSLPEGHGRLIDADALVSEIKDLKKSPWYKDNTNFAYLPRKEAVEIIEELIVGNASTIIEADKTESEDKE